MPSTVNDTTGNDPGPGYGGRTVRARPVRTEDTDPLDGQEAGHQAAGELLLVGTDDVPADRLEARDGGFEGDGPEHVGRAGLLAVGRRRPDDLVQADQVDGTSPGQEGIAGFEGPARADERTRPERGVELVPAEGHEVGRHRQRAVRGQLGAVDEHGNLAFVGSLDDLVEWWPPPGDVGRAGDGQERGPHGSGVERRTHRLDVEGPLASALDIASPRHPAPGQQVGVVLHDGGDNHVVRCQSEPVGEMVDGFSGVAAEDGHIRPVGIAAAELEHGAAGRFVGGGGSPGSEAGAPMDARVPRQECADPVGCLAECLGRRRLVELDGTAFDPVDARDHRAGTDQLDERCRSVPLDPSAGVGHLGHGRVTIRAAATGGGYARQPMENAPPDATVGTWRRRRSDD